MNRCYNERSTRTNYVRSSIPHCTSEGPKETTTHLSHNNRCSESNIKQAPPKYNQKPLSQSDLRIALYASGRYINKTRGVNGLHKAHCFCKEIDIGLSFHTVVNTHPAVCC
jgi:hypothetical protein